MAKPKKSESYESSLSTPEIRDLYPEFSRLLNELRDRILKMDQEARKNLDEQLVLVPSDEADISVIDVSADYFLQLSDNQRRELMEIRDAFERMERGVYGICESGGEPISVSRLRKQPYARYCIDCQTELEKTTNIAWPKRRPKT